MKEGRVDIAQQLVGNGDVDFDNLFQPARRGLPLVDLSQQTQQASFVRGDLGDAQGFGTGKEIALEIMKPQFSRVLKFLVGFYFFGQKFEIETRQAVESDLKEAMALAQGMTDASLQEAAKAEGTLNTLRYGDLLLPRKLVGLRGAGREYDGVWYVKKVTHKIQRGEYKQSFTLTREGTGPKSSKV